MSPGFPSPRPSAPAERESGGGMAAAETAPLPARPEHQQPTAPERPAWARPGPRLRPTAPSRPRPAPPARPGPVGRGAVGPVGGVELRPGERRKVGVGGCSGAPGAGKEPSSG